MERRSFLKTAGIGSLGALAAAKMLPEPATTAVNTVPDMKITKVDVVRDMKFKGQRLQQKTVL